jgi:hypothetical protein
MSSESTLGYDHKLYTLVTFTAIEAGDHTLKSQEYVSVHVDDDISEAVADYCEDENIIAITGWKYTD